MRFPGLDLEKQARSYYLDPVRGIRHGRDVNDIDINLVHP